MVLVHIKFDKRLLYNLDMVFTDDINGEQDLCCDKQCDVFVGKTNGSPWENNHELASPKFWGFQSDIISFLSHFVQVVPILHSVKAHPSIFYNTCTA